MTDGGNGFSHDWATWIRPRIALSDGKEILLTDLNWKSATSGYGNTRKNANCSGGPLLVKGERIANGIGVHATSKIVYALPEGAERFLGEGALDDGGTVRNGEEKTPTSVRQPGTTSLFNPVPRTDLTTASHGSRRETCSQG